MRLFLKSCLFNILFFTSLLLFLFSFTSQSSVFADHQCPQGYVADTILGQDTCVRLKPPDCSPNEFDFAPFEDVCGVARLSHDQTQQPGQPSPQEETGEIPTFPLPDSPTSPEKGFTAENLLGKLVSDILPIVLGIAGFLTVIFVIISGIQFVTSSGNPEAAAAARSRLIFALVGFALIILAFATTQIIDRIFLGGSGIF